MYFTRSAGAVSVNGIEKVKKTDGKGRGAGLYRHSAFYGCYAAGWFGSNRMGFPCVRAEVHL